MLNKTDKCFLITLVMSIISTTLPIILIGTLIGLNIKFLPEIIFSCAVINYIFILPILFVIQIITFIIKIIAKNKSPKDWLIILANTISVLLLSLFLILLVAIIMDPLI